MKLVSVGPAVYRVIMLLNSRSSAARLFMQRIIHWLNPMFFMMCGAPIFILKMVMKFIIKSLTTSVSVPVGAMVVPCRALRTIKPILR